MEQEFYPFDVEGDARVEYERLNPYIQDDVDLLVQTAIWVDYMHTWLRSEKDQKDFIRQFEGKADKLAFIDEITSVYDPNKMVAYFYLHFNPELATVAHVENTVKRYGSNMDELWQRLYSKYILNLSHEERVQAAAQRRQARMLRR